MTTTITLLLVLAELAGASLSNIDTALQLGPR
jgi:hypothetical protein